MIVRFKISTSQDLRSIVNGLISRSCWFEVDPLPQDEYWVFVKEEQEAFVKTLCGLLPKKTLKVQFVLDSMSLETHTHTCG